jgi:hypothetical protein
MGILLYMLILSIIYEIKIHLNLTELEETELKVIV